MPKLTSYDHKIASKELCTQCHVQNEKNSQKRCVIFQNYVLESVREKAHVTVTDLEYV